MSPAIGFGWWRVFFENRMAESIDLKTISDSRGSLTVLEKLPFQIKRVYYLHSIQSNAMRGGHAHKELDRIMVAVKGSFDVSIRGNRWSDHRLNSPEKGLRIGPLEWVEIGDFSPDAVCLVLASEEHDESDCIRDFQDFKKLLKSQNMCDCNQGRLPCTCERSVQ